MNRLIAACVALLALGGATLYRSTAHAAPKPPTGMERFLTSITQDVDTYWTNTGLVQPHVAYHWIPAGQEVSTGCGKMGQDAAAYCRADGTIYISETFATHMYAGGGDFAAAFVVAHEFGHAVQDELGLYDAYGDQLPTMAFELQADCYAGTWANSTYQQNRLDDGDVEEAINAALAVGDFDATNPEHHGTPEQRAGAWETGFQSGDPQACSQYLST